VSWSTGGQGGHWCNDGSFAFYRRGAAKFAVTGLRPRNSIHRKRGGSSGSGCPLGLFTFQSDASIAEDCKRAIAETVCPLWALDVLVHAAGGAVSGGFFEVTEEHLVKALSSSCACRAAAGPRLRAHMISRGKAANRTHQFGSRAHAGCLGCNGVRSGRRGPCRSLPAHFYGTRGPQYSR